MIAAVNAVTGEKIEFRDDYIGTPVTHLVLSNKDPYLACFFENGAAVLYDLRSGTGTPLPTAYAKGEIRKLCFSDRDGFLLALTTGGRVDCFRTGTLEPVFSKANCFAASCELIDWFEAVEDPDNSRLILTAANESGKTDPMDLMHAGYWTTVVNTVSGEITARPDHICAWSVKHGRALIADGSKLGTCKVHNLKDLTEWARSSLKDPAE